MKWLSPWKSAAFDTARLWRSSDFGVKITSGLRNVRCIWRRSTWKMLAGVVQFATCILSPAHNCRNRSGRAELCSGPCPS